MSNIIKFPNTRWNPKTNNFYKIMKPARMVIAFIIITALVGILTAIFGPASLILMAVIFMFYTMACLP